MKNKSLILNFNPAFITAANVILGQFLTCQHISYLKGDRGMKEPWVLWEVSLRETSHVKYLNKVFVIQREVI